MTNAEEYTEIVKEQEIKSVTVYLFFGTEMTFKQVFNCEKEAGKFGKTAYDVVSTAKKNGKRCTNGYLLRVC